MKRNEIKFEDSFDHFQVFQQELQLNTQNKGFCIWHKEKTPSLQVFNTESGTTLCKCYGCDKSSNLWGFLMHKYKFTYNDAIEYVKNGNFNLISNGKIPTIKRKLEVEFNDIKFTRKHSEYWDGYYLPEDFLKNNHVYACDKFAINGKLKKVPEDRLLFVYFCPEIEECKFLYIGESVKKEEKWRSINIPNTHLWGIWKLQKKVDKLIVAKSYKDQLILNYIGNYAISVQNESSKILLENNVDKINKLGDIIYVGFGTDDQGKQSSIEITKRTGWKWINTPNYCLKYGVNDFAEYGKEFGLNQLKKYVYGKMGI